MQRADAADIARALKDEERGVLREARILTALNPTDVPHPHCHAACDDPALIGACFYVMDMVEGRIFWDATVPDVPNAERAAIFDAMSAMLAT